MFIHFRTFILVELGWNNHRIMVDAFLDSGPVHCFVDAKWAKKHSLPIHSSQKDFIMALDGCPLGHGVVTEVADIMLTSIQVDNHVEEMFCLSPLLFL